MDIVAHALWATAAAKAGNRYAGTRLRVAWFAFWTMFPDLFSFTPMVVAGLWSLLSGAERMHVHSVAGLGLYDLSHSFVVFVPLFIAVSLILRRPVWEMTGWALHIALDIPTHSRYATPFLWPLSEYRFIGVAWWHWWFIALNYAALATVFLLLRHMERHRKQSVTESPEGSPESSSSKSYLSRP